MPEVIIERCGEGDKVYTGEEIVRSMKMVAEGVETARSVKGLAQGWASRCRYPRG